MDLGDGIVPLPYADILTIFNFAVDVLALLPQLYLIAHSRDKYCSASTRDFVGLLGLAKILRLSFWALNFINNLLLGMPLMCRRRSGGCSQGVFGGRHFKPH